jgi:hypothetical protein
MFFHRLEVFNTCCALLLHMLLQRQPQNAIRDSFIWLNEKYSIIVSLIGEKEIVAKCAENMNDQRTSVVCLVTTICQIIAMLTQRKSYTWTIRLPHCTSGFSPPTFNTARWPRDIARRWFCLLKEPVLSRDKSL